MSPFEIGILILFGILVVTVIAAVLAHFFLPSWYAKTVAPVAPTVDPILAELRNLVNKPAPAAAPINITVHSPSVPVTTAGPSAPATTAAAAPAFIPGSDNDPAVVANKAKIAHFIATAQCDPSKVDLKELGVLLTVPAHPSLGGGLDFATGAVTYDAGTTPDAGLRIQGKIITNLPLTEAEKVFITNNVPTFYWTLSDSSGNIGVTPRPQTPPVAPAPVPTP